MSVQKYRVRKNDSFTTILNSVAQNLKHYEALGLYIYLLSLPENFIFHKKQLADHAKIGRDKINRLLKILHAHNLIEFAQMRNEKGSFAHLDLHVKDGTSFKINNLEKPAQPFTEKPLTDNQSLVNSTYKRNIKKINNNNKINISCASDDARDRDFYDFWNIYPKKKDKKRAKERWKKIDHKKIPMIMEKLKNQIKEDIQWRDIKFIPNPTTYLENELWEDEVIKKTQSQKIVSSFEYYPEKDPNKLCNSCKRPEYYCTCKYTSKENSIFAIKQIKENLLVKQNGEKRKGV